MSRSRESTNDDAAERVIVTIDGLEELSAIRGALEGIREDIDWWLNNRRREHWLPVQLITSMPADPLAPDWAERLNKFTAADLPDAPEAELATRDLAPQVDALRAFCCEAPDLQWTGDPELPGVACIHCGYVIADCGSVVMYPALDADEKAADPAPTHQQQELFGGE